MSRSNTPSGHTGQPPQAQQPQWRMQPELEVPPSRGAPGHLPAAGQTAGHYVPYPPNAQQAQPGYAYPPQGPAAYTQAEQAYAYANAQPGPHGAAGAASGAGGGVGGHQFAPPPAAGYAAPDRYAAPAPQMPELRGSQYDQWAQQPAAQNPQSYDLGNYNPATLVGAQAAAYQQAGAQSAQHAGMAEFNQQPQAAYASAAYGNYAPPYAEYQPQQQWSPQDMAHQNQQAGYAGQSHGSNGQPAFAAPQGNGQQIGALAGHPSHAQPNHPQASHPQAGGQAQAADYDDDEYEDEEEPRRRGRGLMVVAALVGAIGLGGGLAYGYKTYMIPPTAGNIPVARADKQPAKIKPATPDGKQMAGSGSALQNGEDGAPIRPVQAATVASADADGNGSRKVQTMQIGRDGSIAAPPASLPTSQQTMATSVPGMQMVMPSTPSQQRAMPVPNLPDPQPVQPRVSNVPAPLNAPAAAAVAPAPTKKVVAQLPVPKKSATRDDLAASGGSALGAADAVAPAAPRKPSGAGYMAVISNHKTQIEAMKAFADMQQKYPALQGKQPVVQEADLTSKGMGIVQRLMVGPPGSKASAVETCKQMEAAGHKAGDCWTINY
jgi:hypothetical protein